MYKIRFAEYTKKCDENIEKYAHDLHPKHDTDKNICQKKGDRRLINIKYHV